MYDQLDPQEASRQDPSGRGESPGGIGITVHSKLVQ